MPLKNAVKDPQKAPFSHKKTKETPPKPHKNYKRKPKKHCCDILGVSPKKALF